MIVPRLVSVSASVTSGLREAEALEDPRYSVLHGNGNRCSTRQRCPSKVGPRMS